jgi:hypothetical protein
MALRDCDYQQAFHAMMEGDAELKRAYTECESPSLVRSPEVRSTPAKVRQEVNAKVQQYMIEHPTADYIEAYHAVLDRDPALKKRYAES